MPPESSIMKKIGDVNSEIFDEKCRLSKKTKWQSIADL